MPMIPNVDKLALAQRIWDYGSAEVRRYGAEKWLDKWKRPTHETNLDAWRKETAELLVVFGKYLRMTGRKDKADEIQAAMSKLLGELAQMPDHVDRPYEGPQLPPQQPQQPQQPQKPQQQQQPQPQQPPQPQQQQQPYPQQQQQPYPQQQQQQQHTPVPEGHVYTGPQSTGVWGNITEWGISMAYIVVSALVVITAWMDRGKRFNAEGKELHGAAKSRKAK